MNLMQVIFNENIKNMFILLCVEDYSSKQIATFNIKEVPAIVVSAENQLPAIYEGPAKCAQWINNFTLNRRKNLVQQVEQQRRLIQKAHSIVRTQEGGPVDYNDNEMDGISDGYAYTNTDLGQAKSFVIVGDEENCFIRTPQLIEGKIDTEALRRQLSDLESSRNTDTSQFMKIMEQNQIKSVINYNANM